MACYHPVAAYQEKAGDPVKFGIPGQRGNLALPCNKCIGCRTDRATMWANRCTHEASMWDHNTLLTLTYADEHLPQDAHLDPRALQLFLKRLRRHAHKAPSDFDRDRGANIRYFACGEYGSTTQRPHYHALIFNAGFRDKERTGIRDGHPVYQSDTVRQLWPYGHHELGTVTPAAAAYVAQYNLKKQGRGDFDPDGVERPAPFLRMSLKPAIGADWLAEYAADMQHGYLVQAGRKHPLPRYYRDKIKERLPELREQIQQAIERHRMSGQIGDRKQKERLEAQEIIHTRTKELGAQRQ